MSTLKIIWTAWELTTSWNNANPFIGVRSLIALCFTWKHRVSNQLPQLKLHTLSPLMQWLGWRPAVSLSEHPMAQVTLEARSIELFLDSASSASFIPEHLAQSLRLTRTSQSAVVSGIAGLARKSAIQSITNFYVSSVNKPTVQKINVAAVVLPRVTPHHPIHLDQRWKHLYDIELSLMFCLPQCQTCRMQWT